MSDEELMSQADFLELMRYTPQTTEDLFVRSGLKMRTIRSRLATLLAAGKVRQIYTLKDMRKRRYIANGNDRV
jgi:predicted HTH transcriptional regulator